MAFLWVAACGSFTGTDLWQEKRTVMKKVVELVLLWRLMAFQRLFYDQYFYNIYPLAQLSYEM
jgi:hypothetical protein